MKLMATNVFQSEAKFVHGSQFQIPPPAPGGESAPVPVLPGTPVKFPVRVQATTDKFPQFAIAPPLPPVPPETPPVPPCPARFAVTVEEISVSWLPLYSPPPSPPKPLLENELPLPPIP